MMKVKKIVTYFFLVILVSFNFNCKKFEIENNPMSSNLVDGKINLHDTLKISFDNNIKEIISKIKSGKISFEINNGSVSKQLFSLDEPNEDIYISFFTDNLLLGKKELIINEDGFKRSFKFTLLNDISPKVYDFEILNEFKRGKNLYTQGLEFYNDTLFESLGKYNNSKLLKVDFRDGTVFKEYKLPNQYFAEGITILDDKIYQLTWQEKIGFVYNIDNFEKINTFDYNNSKEGWGLCNDGVNLYKSDGTEKIWILDKITQNELNHIEVYTNKNKIVGLNELEWVNGKIYANRYQFEGIAIINPKNGAIEGVINLKTLKNKVTQHKDLDVINGIAFNKKRNSIFVTGKMWDKIFEIRIKK